MGWNFADVWEHNADRFAAEPALIQGPRTTTWAELDRRADAVAAAFGDLGIVAGAKVAHYLYTCPEYVESMFAMFKAGVVPVNTNYRYTDDELAYLWDNADAEAIVFHGAFTPRCERLRARFPGVRAWLWVDDGTHPCPPWAVAYEDAAATVVAGRVHPPAGRSGDDLYMLYTGGTTGMPKGVMWRQDDLLVSLDVGSKHPLPAEPGWEAFDRRIAKPGPRHLPAAPLMHGTGAFGAMWGLVIGGTIVMMEGRRFDPVELLDTIAARRVNGMTIVGDAFAKPVLALLDAEPDRWDISSLRFVLSSGAMWSSATKRGLLRHNQRLMMVDSLGSSEAISMAADTFDAAVADGGTTTARFRLNATTRVIADDGHEVQPGSGETGRVARKGRSPLGYYKDPVKSAGTFVEIDGERWTIPGDYAEVDADGTLRLLGRGSQCINTGGEKVYPEEVEEALKLHPSVADAAVVGLPDDRFGESIAALVEPAAGATIDARALIDHVKVHLASYKAPRNIVPVATIGRAPNGKLDYRRLKAEAEAALS